MTHNQLEYWANVETRRANLARERETNRSNQVNERETNRHNLETEAQGRTNLSELGRHNRAGEIETRRHNKATENVALGNLSLGRDQLAELRSYHNRSIDLDRSKYNLDVDRFSRYKYDQDLGHAEENARNATSNRKITSERESRDKDLTYKYVDLITSTTSDLLGDFLGGKRYFRGNTSHRTGNSKSTTKQGGSKYGSYTSGKQYKKVGNAEQAQRKSRAHNSKGKRIQDWSKGLEW